MGLPSASDIISGLKALDVPGAEAAPSISDFLGYVESQFHRLIGDHMPRNLGHEGYSFGRYLSSSGSVQQIQRFLELVKGTLTEASQNFRGIEPHSSGDRALSFLRSALPGIQERLRSLDSPLTDLVKNVQGLIDKSQLARDVFDKANRSPLFRSLLELRNKTANRPAVAGTTAVATTSTVSLALEVGGTSVGGIVAEGGLGVLGIALAGTAVAGAGVGCGMNVMLLDGPCLGIWSSGQYQESVNASEQRAVFEKLGRFGECQPIPGKNGIWCGPQRPVPKVAEK